jgi:hypothetical protein
MRAGIYDEPLPEVTTQNLTAAIAGRVAYIRGLALTDGPEIGRVSGEIEQLGAERHVQAVDLSRNPSVRMSRKRWVDATVRTLPS